MKKRILPVMLLISPYIFVFIAKIDYSELPIQLPELFFILVFVVLIPNMVYAFVLDKHEENSNVLLFWDMVLKLCNIPIYIMAFTLGFEIFFTPLGIIMALLYAVLTYVLLLATSMYGVSGLLKARREKKITKATAIVNIILHFLFCADVISAVTMFCLVKAKEKNQT